MRSKNSLFRKWHSRFRHDLTEIFSPPEFLDSCRATSLLAELEDDDEELPDADEDDNDEDDANDDEVILHDFSVQLEILPF
jgi:hypothetical protein